MLRRIARVNRYKGQLTFHLPPPDDAESAAAGIKSVVTTNKPHGSCKGVAGVTAALELLSPSGGEGSRVCPAAAGTASGPAAAAAVGVAGGVPCVAAAASRGSLPASPFDRALPVASSMRRPPNAKQMAGASLAERSTSLSPAPTQVRAMACFENNAARAGILFCFRSFLRPQLALPSLSQPPSLETLPPCLPPALPWCCPALMLPCLGAALPWLQITVTWSQRGMHVRAESQRASQQLQRLSLWQRGRAELQVSLQHLNKLVLAPACWCWRLLTRSSPCGRPAGGVLASVAQAPSCAASLRCPVPPPS